MLTPATVQSLYNAQDLSIAKYEHRLSAAPREQVEAYAKEWDEASVLRKIGMVLNPFVNYESRSAAAKRILTKNLSDADGLEGIAREYQK